MVMRNRLLQTIGFVVSLGFLISCSQETQPVTSVAPLPAPVEKPTPTPIIPPKPLSPLGQKIALLLPVGAEAPALRARGIELEQAARLAATLLNLDELSITTYDTKGDVSTTKAAITKALDDNNDVVIGPLLRENVKSAAPFTKKARIPMIALTTDSDIAEPGVYIFGRTIHNDLKELFTYLAKQRLTRIAILAPDNDYGLMAFREAQNLAPSMGLEVIRSAAVTGDSNQVLEQLKAFTDGLPRESFGPVPDFDVLIIPAGVFTIQTVLPGLIYAEFPLKNVTLAGLGLWDDPDALSDQLMQGGIFPDADPRAREAFRRSYLEKFGSEPSRIADLAFDTTALVGTLVRLALENPNTSYELENEAGYQGISGLFRFEPDGTVQRKLSIRRIKNGRFEIIQPAQTSF